MAKKREREKMNLIHIINREMKEEDNDINIQPLTLRKEKSSHDFTFAYIDQFIALYFVCLRVVVFFCSFHFILTKKRNVTTI